MILYVDSSALVKRYLAEKGSREVCDLIDRAQVAGSSMLGRIEVAAALARAARGAIITAAAQRAAYEAMAAHWPDMVGLPVVDSVLRRAEGLVVTQRLRGYDAVHLASAAFWQELLDEPVTLATFDRELWNAAANVGLDVWPVAIGPSS
jgi:predicted nucleic acid-binding protein